MTRVYPLITLALLLLVPWTSGGFSSILGDDSDASSVDVSVQESTSMTDGFFRTNRNLLRSIHDLESELEDASSLRAATLPAMQRLLVRFRGGDERVVVGEDGHLFLRAGIDHVVGRPFLDPARLAARRLGGEAWEAPPEPDPRPAIFELRDVLSARGIELIVLFAPPKASVHPELLRPGVEAPVRNPSTDALVGELREAGVRVVDPSGALVRASQELGAPVYLRDDSHWNPAGVDAAARELAAMIQEMDVSFVGPEMNPRRAPLLQSGEGDLLRLLGLPAEDVSEFAEGEITTEPVEGLRGPAEVLLLGDSFSNVFSRPSEDVAWGAGAGLAEQLGFHLRRRVELLAVNGEGAKASRERLFAEGEVERRLRGKKLVVWQVAARELSIGDWAVDR